MEKLDLLNENNYTICFNGSLIVNNENELFSSYIEKNVVIKIFDMALEGQTRREISDELNSLEILPQGLYKI